jgi:inner membrane transporter RhtA
MPEAVRLGKPVRVSRPQRGALTAGPVAGGGILLASCLSIQVGAALATTTFARVGAAGAAGWRFALAAVVLLVTARPRLRSWTAARWRLVIAFGLAAAGNEVCLYQALDRLPLGMAVTLEFVGPLAVALPGARRPRHLVCAVLAVVALLGTALPYMLELAALRRLSASMAGVLFAIEPAIAALVGLIVLGQSLTVLQIAGMALVVVAGATVLHQSAE